MRVTVKITDQGVQRSGISPEPYQAGTCGHLAILRYFQTGFTNCNVLLRKLPALRRIP